MDQLDRNKNITDIGIKHLKEGLKALTSLEHFTLKFSKSVNLKREKLTA